MEVKRGKVPETIERPIAIEFTKDEVLELFASFVSSKLQSKVRFTSLKSGADAATLVITGSENVPVVLGGPPAVNTPQSFQQTLSIKPAGPEPEHSPVSSPKP